MSEAPERSAVKGIRNWHQAVRWFAAEFLVVVTGVLIALALGSVYQSRQDREREGNYLQQLVADLRETERLMESADSMNVVWDRSITSLLKSFRGNQTPPRDSVLRWIIDLQFDNPVPVLGTADALIATGDLQLIRDVDLRSAVTSYLSGTREYNLPWLLTVEEEFVSARTLFRNRVDLLEAESAAEISSSSPSKASIVLYDVGHRNPYPLEVAELSRDREAYFLLTRLLVAKRQFLTVREIFRSDARALREQLEEALATD